MFGERLKGFVESSVALVAGRATTLEANKLGLLADVENKSRTAGAVDNDIYSVCIG